MPAVPTILHDQLWTILEAGAATPPLFKVGNRINRSTATWRMRDQSRKAPNDFPKLEIEVGTNAAHSAYAMNPVLATEAADYPAPTDQFEVERTEEALVTITENKPTDDSPNDLRDAVIGDFMRARARLGIPELVMRIGLEGERFPFRSRRRDTRKEEFDVRGNQLPWPGTVTEIRFTIVCWQDGQASLIP